MVSHRCRRWHHYWLMSSLVTCILRTGLQMFPNCGGGLVHWRVGDAIRRDFGRLEKWSERN